MNKGDVAEQQPNWRFVHLGDFDELGSDFIDALVDGELYFVGVAM